MKSRIFSSDHIKTVSKGQAWIPSFLILGFLLAFPVTGLVKLSSWRNMEYTTEQIAALYHHLWEDGFVLTGMAVTGIAAFMNSLNGFIYLYSAKKTDFYHGLPQKRSEMFLERTVTGLVYYLIPYIVMEFLIVCIGAARGFFSLQLMGMAVKMLLLHLLIYFVIYFSIVLIICVTGNMLMGILCLGGMYLYGIALNVLMLSYGEAFLHTFSSARRYGIFKFLVDYASPGTLIFSMVTQYGDGHAGMLILTVVILGMILAILSWFAYVRRPSESAGKSMVYGWIATLIKIMVTVPMGLAVGAIFYALTTGKSQLLWWGFGLVLGTVLVHGLIESVYHMSFQKFFARKGQLILAGVLVAGCALIYQKDLLHFDSYIPKQDEIASVNINMNSGDSDYYAVATKTEDGFYEVTDTNYWDDPKIAFSGEGGIGNETYAALQDIVEQNQNVNMGETVRSYFSCVKYTLKSGRVVYRNYWINSDLLRTLIGGLYEEENLKEKKFGFLDLDEKYLNNLNLTDAGGNGYSIFQNDKEKMSELLAALKKDVDAATVEELMELSEIKIDFEYQLPTKRSMSEMIPGKNEECKSYVDWMIGICPSFKNTLAILKETGYPLTIDELNINKITLIYNYGDANETEADKVTYETPEEIKALKKALVPEVYGYLGDDAETSSNINVTAYTDQGELMVSFGLRISELPDFVQEKMDELDITQQSVLVDEPEVSDGAADVYDGSLE